MIELAREHLRARRIAEALRCFEKCEFREAASDIWFCHMLAGDFEGAWRTADEIERSWPSRVWNGDGFEGRRVLIRCVHGLGDTIQFIRYARELKRAGAVSVVAQMHPELVELVSTATGLDSAITWGPRPAFDTEIEVMELPWAFRTRSSGVPAHVPYLFPGEEPVARRARRFGVQSGDDEKLRVALIWTSSKWDETRSAPLDAFESALAEVPGVAFCSLQHGPKHIEAAGRGWLRYDGEQSSDILDTAADLMNADLLITVDTMAAHLAGALGRPVWVLLKYEADWRWMTARCDSPWYPTMRLYRQPRPGDWATPLERMAATLAELSRNRYREASFRSPDPLSLF
jgi:hypothetical protein